MLKDARSARVWENGRGMGVSGTDGGKQGRNACWKWSICKNSKAVQYVARCWHGFSVASSHISVRHLSGELNNDQAVSFWAFSVTHQETVFKSFSQFRLESQWQSLVMKRDVNFCSGLWIRWERLWEGGGWGKDVEIGFLSSQRKPAEQREAGFRLDDKNPLTIAFREISNSTSYRAGSRSPCGRV